MFLSIYPLGPLARPIHTWLCATEADLKPLNFGLSCAWKKASIQKWKSVVDTSMLMKIMPQEEEKKEK